MIDYIWRINNFDVYYSNETNGGGDFLALEYIDVVREWYTNVDHILEWCSGPGFIGYGMYASGLCNRVSFNDMYSPAVSYLEKTKANSNDASNINIYQGSSLDNVPDNVKFDLVVGNPPHWKSVDAASNSLGFDISQYTHVSDILVDQDWNSHKNFYVSMKRLLSDNGRILLQENANGSSPEDFKDMIELVGLKISSIAHSRMYADKNIYYIEVVHA
jgi:methylase of polypeptide subunit release factors